MRLCEGGGLKSRIYEGTLRHRRMVPAGHQFEYRVFMPYLRLDELPELFANSRLWSAKGRALAEFRRSDFLGDPAKPLQEEVQRRIFEDTGEEHKGPVYLLANLRYFGHVMNPIACYYCFNQDESQLQYVVAQVTNTPWEERHSYVLAGPREGRWLKTEFDKAFHVSPFNPMAMRYRWRSNVPDRRLVLHMENLSEGERVFDATLSLVERPLTTGRLSTFLLKYPFMTAKVGIAIYWQALRLYLKGIPVHTHPGKSVTGAVNE